MVPRSSVSLALFFFCAVLTLFMPLASPVFSLSSPNYSSSSGPDAASSPSSSPTSFVFSFFLPSLVLTRPPPVYPRDQGSVARADRSSLPPDDRPQIKRFPQAYSRREPERRRDGRSLYVLLPSCLRRSTDGELLQTTTPLRRRVTTVSLATTSTLRSATSPRTRRSSKPALPSLPPPFFSALCVSSLPFVHRSPFLRSSKPIISIFPLHFVVFVEFSVRPEAAAELRPSPNRSRQEVREDEKQEDDEGKHRTPQLQRRGQKRAIQQRNPFYTTTSKLIRLLEHRQQPRLLLRQLIRLLLRPSNLLQQLSDPPLHLLRHATRPSKRPPSLLARKQL